MPKKVRLLQEARMELRAIAAFYMQKAEASSARKITDRILDELDGLSEFPEMGYVPPYDMLASSGYRVLLVKEYLCFYRIEKDEVHVAHIVYGSTDYIRRLFN